MIQTHISIEPELFQTLQYLAQEQGRSQSAVVADALRLDTWKGGIYAIT